MCLGLAEASLLREHGTGMAAGQHYALHNAQLNA
jgi:hypothetical protein